MPRPRLWWLLVLAPVPPVLAALGVTGLVMPAVFVLSAGKQTVLEREAVSITVAVVLIALYACALAFMYVTHEHLFRTPGTDERAEWSVRRAVGVLIGATVGVA